MNEEVSESDELSGIPERLVRRTRPPVLFVSGSNQGAVPVAEMAHVIGNSLAQFNLELASLAGDAGTAVSFAFGQALLAEDRYDPSRVRFYFRQIAEPAPLMVKRIGTAVYTGLKKEDIRKQLLSDSRAVLALGGGKNTAEEIASAIKIGVPVIPLPTCGGAAAEARTANTIEQLLGANNVDSDDRRDWGLLEHTDREIVAAATVRLVKKAMRFEAFPSVLLTDTDSNLLTEVVMLRDKLNTLQKQLDGWRALSALQDSEWKKLVAERDALREMLAKKEKP